MVIEAGNCGESQIVYFAVTMVLIALVSCEIIHICEVGVAFGAVVMLVADMIDKGVLIVITQHAQSTCQQVTFAFRFYMLSKRADGEEARATGANMVSQCWQLADP
jgi:hypothetical protein